jgi:hypothetical protein
VVLVATSGGERVPRCMGRLIHRSAWNRNSRKFVSRILHRTPSESLKDGF